MLFVEQETRIAEQLIYKYTDMRAKNDEHNGGGGKSKATVNKIITRVRVQQEMTKEILQSFLVLFVRILSFATHFRSKSTCVDARNCYYKYAKLFYLFLPPPALFVSPVTFAFCLLGYF